MSETTSAGTKISIGTTADAHASDTYIQIGEVTNLGEFGRTYQEITHEPLASRDVKKHKGTRNDGSLAIQLARVIDDAGQEAVEDALDTDYDYNFKIELNDAPEGGMPTLIYVKAKVMSFVDNIGGPNQVVGGTITLGIKTGSKVIVPAAEEA
ncbi:hypothetical protein FHS85_001751 [Rhodoligotrophos appendicifer]|uniref:hypothetical protein n=1 Tax=Rhodoligotrophos appendicifer TaxID=987056 RepID=UPI0011848C2D|nr:hypothetical protein [Rhodoligotrophos appendicifer]